VGVVPSSVLPDIGKPLRELPQQVDEFLGDVPYRPLDLPLVLRVVRVCEQRPYSPLPAPSLPLFLELATVVREDLLRLPRDPSSSPVSSSAVGSWSNRSQTSM